MGVRLRAKNMYYLHMHATRTAGSGYTQVDRYRLPQSRQTVCAEDNIILCVAFKFFAWTELVLGMNVLSMCANSAFCFNGEQLYGVT